MAKASRALAVPRCGARAELGQCGLSGLRSDVLDGLLSMTDANGRGTAEELEELLRSVISGASRAAF